VTTLPEKGCAILNLKIDLSQVKILEIDQEMLGLVIGKFLANTVTAIIGYTETLQASSALNLGEIRAQRA
jgi:hypothetical protein